MPEPFQPRDFAPAAAPTSALAAPSSAGLELDRDTRTLFKQTAEVLRQKIVSGEFPVGKPLPSERELSELLHVSRVPVREALKALEFVGVVQQVRGKGVFVAAPDPVPFFLRVGPLLAVPGRETLDQLYEIRLLIESHAAALAAERKTPEGLAKIESFLLPEDDPDSLAQERAEAASEGFHKAICEMSGNRISLIFQCLSSELLRESTHLTLWDPERCRASARDHRAIFEAIRAGDAKGAEKAMQDHLKAARERFLQSRLP